MLNFIIFVLLSSCYAFELPQESCSSDLKIDNDYYNISDSYSIGEAYPTDAHFDRFGNLFYVETGRDDNGFHFNVMLLRSASEKAERIPGLPSDSSYSIAIDYNKTKVYFGTGQGLFMYNYENQAATRISNKKLKINMLFLDKDGNKYITESSNGIEELYLLDGNKKIRFHTLEALNELAIDDKNNFYFIREEKLYVLKSTMSSPSYIGNLTYDGMAQIFTFKHTVYVACEKLLYVHDNETMRLKIVDNVPGKVTAVALNDVGVLILGTRGKILKYKKNECYHRNVGTPK